MNKKLNTKAIFNELSGQSSYFKDEPAKNYPKKQQEKPSSKRLKTKGTSQPTNEQNNETTNERTNVERVKIRHTFDIFKDQLMSFKKIQLERETTFGKRVRIGDLAQQALDMFITTENNKK